MFVRSLTLGVAAAALLSSGAMAADLIIPTTPEPIYEAAGFSWDGLYAGVQAGGAFFGSDAFAGDDITFGTIGAHVGVNFMVADPILLGVELQGSWMWNNDDFVDDVSVGELLALGRVGAVVTDQVLVYGAAGLGVQFGDDVFADDSEGIYALGGGVEVAVTDNVSIRGEILGIGYMDDDAGNDFFDEARATVGVSYHF